MVGHGDAVGGAAGASFSPLALAFSSFAAAKSARLIFAGQARCPDQINICRLNMVGLRSKVRTFLRKLFRKADSMSWNMNPAMSTMRIRADLILILYLPCART